MEAAWIDPCETRGDAADFGVEARRCAAELSDARVDVLVYQEGANSDAWQCPACGRAAVEGGPCPLDGTEMKVVATDGHRLSYSSGTIAKQDEKRVRELLHK